MSFRKSIYRGIFILLILSLNLFAQYNGKLFGISANYKYTTTSRIFFQPNSPDAFLRRTNVPFDDIFSYSAELRYRLSEPLILGFSVEYLKQTGTKTINVIGQSGPVSIDAEEGYRIIPLELSVYYLMPFSTEKFKFLMGGGVGYYWGEHIRNFEDISAVNVSRNFAFGILVAAGMDYIINEFIAARFEMRFRDPEINLTSRYSKETVNIGGQEFQLPSKTFESKVNVDGITFSLGVVFHFF